MPRNTARYMVVACVTDVLRPACEYNEGERVLKLTREEVLRADAVGLPVYMDFDLNNRVGTVITSYVNAETGSWSLGMALVVTLAFPADELLTGPWSAVTPMIRHVRAGKAIEGFSIVQSTHFTGSKIFSVQPQRLVV